MVLSRDCDSILYYYIILYQSSEILPYTNPSGLAGISIEIQSDQRQWNVLPAAQMYSSLECCTGVHYLQIN